MRFARFAVLSTLVVFLMIVSQACSIFAQAGSSQTSVSIQLSSGYYGSNVTFSPNSVTIAPGDSVSWTNNSSDTVTLASSDAGFNTSIDPNGTFSFTFDTAGSYSVSGSTSSGATGSMTVTVQSTQATVPTIEIDMAAYYFQGPVGKSDSTANPMVIAKLKNGQKVRVVFKNVGSVQHEVVSPLFDSATELSGQLPQYVLNETVYKIDPGKTLTFEFTPQFRNATDGQPLTFDLSCHELQGTSGDHFLHGMHALIEVVP